LSSRYSATPRRKPGQVARVQFLQRLGQCGLHQAQELRHVEFKLGIGRHTDAAAAVAAHQVLAAQRRLLQHTAQAPQRGVERTHAGRLGLVGPQSFDEFVAREETALRQRQEGQQAGSAAQQADCGRPQAVFSAFYRQLTEELQVKHLRDPCTTCVDASAAAPRPGTGGGDYSYAQEVLKSLCWSRIGH